MEGPFCAGCEISLLISQLEDEEEVLEMEVQVDEEEPLGFQKKKRKEEGQRPMELGLAGEKDHEMEEREETKEIQRKGWDLEEEWLSCS